MSTTILGKAAIFFSVSNDECTAAHWGRVWESDPSPTKKMQRSLPERQTELKNRCLRLPRHTSNPQLKYGKASATTAWKTKSTRTPSLVSPHEKTGDSRFAPNLLPYTGVRAVFFRGHVRSCEKGLCSRDRGLAARRWVTQNRTEVKRSQDGIDDRGIFRNARAAVGLSIAKEGFCRHWVVGFCQVLEGDAFVFYR